MVEKGIPPGKIVSDRLRAAIEAKAKERKTQVNPKAMVTFA